MRLSDWSSMTKDEQHAAVAKLVADAGALASVAVHSVEAESAPLNLVMPQNMVEDTKRIFDSGEYAVDVEFSTPPRVLDAGACVGAFSAFAARRWPGAIITAVEPNPGALVHLRQNLPVGATLVEAAIHGDEPGFTSFYTGAYNLGCAGLAPLADSPEAIDKVGFQVATVPASSLPRAEIVKADMESAEVDFLERYDLSETQVVMYEYHSVKGRIRLDALMRSRGFTLCGGVIRSTWLGTCKWIREKA